MSEKFVLATHNPGKLKEMAEILKKFHVEVVMPADLGLDVDVEETGTTFAENAMLKAKAVCAASGLPAIADDSGLVVDALDGRPGVYSARYGGEEATDDDRNVLLLGEMKDVPKGQRSARFVSAVCCVFPNGDVLRAEGTFEGEIGYAPAGENGFGYDPIFVVGDRTSAEMSPAEKDAVSHRGNALKLFSKDLQNYLEKNK